MSLLNARSLVPKLKSFSESCQELDCDLSIVTETWLVNSEYHNKILRDYQDEHDCTIVRKDRCTGRRGGGVAIWADNQRIAIARAKLPHSKHEVVAVIGRRTGQRRKVLVVGVYIPPWYNAAQNKSFFRYLNDCLILLNRRYDKPYICIGGDFNKRKFKLAVTEANDVKQIETGPTRGNNTLDIIGTNFNDQILETCVVAPIENDFEGADADHRVVFVSFRMPKVPQYDIESYSYYCITEEGADKFGDWIKSVSDKGWHEIRSGVSVNEKVDRLHSSFASAMEQCFEYKTRKKKSSEPVWMADWIRDLIARRRKVFKKQKRGASWLTFKAKTNDIIDKQRSIHYDRLRSKLLDGSSKGFHVYVNALLSGNGPKRWNVRSLAPEKNDKELAEWLADFFNGISSEYTPHNLEDTPVTHYRQLPIIEEHEVVKRIKESKVTSSVPGDLPPKLYEKFVESLAVPITDIFNSISRQFTWPRAWSTEHVTIIPKSKYSDKPNECRNISCTNFLSKIYESFVLKWARQEVIPKPNQFGGEPGCGTHHFLVETMHKITSALEDNRSAVVLTSVDFSKAFNRLEHGPCLSAFAKKGASTSILRLLACFICGRRMTVKVGNQSSDLRQVNAGAPQGSVLGCYLFNIGVDDIEEGCAYPTDNSSDHYESRQVDFPAESTPIRVNTNMDVPDLSPIGESQRDDVEFLPTAVNVPPWMRKPKDPIWRPTTPDSLKFVDDSLHFSVVNMRAVNLVMKNNCLTKITQAPESQAMLAHVIDRAKGKGLLVNDNKTGIMCVSGATSFKASVEIQGRDGEIVGRDSLKCLGVTIDSDCSFTTHTKNVAAKLRGKTWALSRLKRMGMSEDELKKVYVSVIRPSAEYASVAWHSLLNGQQAHSIEKQQNQALKNIVGIGLSAQKMREKLELKTLEERREASVLKFAQKCKKNPRFSHWFTDRQASRYERRKNVNYRELVEPRYRTLRHKRSPLNYMIQRLNDTED